MAYYHKPDCLVKRLDCSVVVKVKVTERFKIPVNVHLDDGPSAAEPFVSKLGVVLDVSSWSRVLCKRIGLLSSSSGSL